MLIRTKFKAASALGISQPSPWNRCWQHLSLCITSCSSLSPDYMGTAHMQGAQMTLYSVLESTMVYKHWWQPYKEIRKQHPLDLLQKKVLQRRNLAKGNVISAVRWACFVYSRPGWGISLSSDKHLMKRGSTAYQTSLAQPVIPCMGKGHHPLPHCSEIFPRAPCCPAEIFEALASTEGLNTKAKCPNPDILTSFGWALYSSTSKPKLRWQLSSFLT